MTIAADPQAPLTSVVAGPAKKRRTSDNDSSSRTLISSRDLARGKGRAIYLVVLIATMVLFSLAFLFPLYWMVIGAFKDSAELSQPTPTLIPKNWHPETYSTAWATMQIVHFFGKTLLYAVGAWLFQIVFDVGVAYSLSKLRPIFGKWVFALILATLMVPSAALLVPNYLAVVDVPLLHLNLINTPFAIWLPAVANAFNIYILKRFFDQVPNDLLDSAAIDGAGRFRVLWHVILPISRPVLAVVSIFAVIGVWKDFLWPLLVQPNPENNTLSTALARLSIFVPREELMAGLVFASVPMIVIFLIFQRSILNGLTAGSIKG